MTANARTIVIDKRAERLYLFKSCVAGTFCPFIERSFRFILNLLSVDYFDDPRQSSCTGFGKYCGVMPPQTTLALNARNLALACDSGYTNVVCTCPTSYGNLKECIEELKDERTKNSVDAILDTIGVEYKDDLHVFHAAEVLHSLRATLRKRSRGTLKGVKVATHHGCHYTKIFYDEVIGGTWEYPTLLDEIFEPFSPELIDYPERTLCCGLGFTHLIGNRIYTEATALRKLESILSGNPDVIVTMCAGCQAVLDTYQKLFENRWDHRAPVLNVAQLAAILLGADINKDACLQFSSIDVGPLLEKMAVI
ncbi:MAG TPA: heterodisulfide reductase-related iron-sulfur binding cluster [Candidatus Acidoferrum sp.]|nr:heterodisulfide reductase-related iron-sulfur binding cluster [Candidatus Acidoferrum sp.]